MALKGVCVRPGRVARPVSVACTAVSQASTAPPPLRQSDARWVLPGPPGLGCVGGGGGVQTIRGFTHLWRSYDSALVRPAPRQTVDSHGPHR